MTGEFWAKLAAVFIAGAVLGGSVIAWAMNGFQGAPATAARGALAMEHWILIVNALAAAVLSVGAFVYREFSRLRRNELCHLQRDLAYVLGHVEQIETKIDRHVAWHAEH